MLITELGVSNFKFASKIGVSGQTLNEQLKGNRSIGLDPVLRILSEFSDLSAEWLLRGTGPMMLNPPPSEHVSPTEPPAATLITPKCSSRSPVSRYPELTEDYASLTASEPQHDYYESRLRIKQERIEALECELARLRQA